METHLYCVMCINAHHIVFMLNKEIVNLGNMNFGYKHGESHDQIITRKL